MNLLMRMAIAIGLVIAVASTAQAEKWNMATYYGDNFQTQNVIKFLEDVENATGKKLEITLHSNATLFKANEIKRAVQTGNVQLGEILINGYGNEDPILEVDAIPFLANDYDAAKKLYKLQKPLLDKFFEAQGVRLLYAVPWPAQGFLSKVPLNSVADMKGSKFRTAGPLLARFGELMGAVPINMPFGDVPQGFETGGVDTFMTSAASSVEIQAWDFISYFTTVGGMLPKAGVIVNAKEFDSLPEDVRAAILKAAATAETRGWQMSAKVMAETTETLRSHGVNIAKPTPEFMSELRKIGDQMTKEWIKKAGAPGKELIVRYETE